MILAVAALALAGCSTVPSNTPEAYTDTNADGVVITEANYLAACEEAGGDRNDCECQYERIVDEVAFEDFKTFEDQLEQDAEDVPEAYRDIVDACARGEIVGPAAGATTTTDAPS